MNGKQDLDDVEIELSGRCWTVSCWTVSVKKKVRMPCRWPKAVKRVNVELAKERNEVKVRCSDAG